MRPSLAISVVLMLLAGAFAGCLGDEEPSVPAAAPVEDNSTSLANVTDDGSGDVPAELGDMEHSHDYWTGRERITLMDEDVTVDTFDAFGFTFFNVIGAGNPAVGGAWLELPDGKIVFEGTGKLEFTVTWSDPTITGMAVRYRSAASPDFSEPQALASGTALAVDVTPEMSDMPHEKTSRWSFLLTPAQAGQTMVGKFHVKVDIIKMRDIENFPPHPKLFGDGHTLTLFEGAAQSAQASAPMMIAGFLTGGSPEERGIGSEKVVPMETLSMTANVTITSASAGVGQVSNVSFLFKPADSNGFRRANMVSGDLATGAFQFAWPVEMQQTDSPYADTSQWAFDLWVSTDPTGQGNGQCGGCSDARVDYTLTVVAYDSLVEGADVLDGRRDG